MKLIKLTQGYFTKVDDADYEMLSKHNWHIDKRSESRIYAYTNLSQGKRKSMHRMILGLTNPKIYCDHKDGNGLNNQRSNLRKCNHSQNMANSRSAKNSSSKYLGVYTYLAQGKYLYWHCSITHNRKVINLGTFKTEKRAAIEYDKHAIIYHGKFANLNILKIKH